MSSRQSRQKSCAKKVPSVYAKNYPRSGTGKYPRRVPSEIVPSAGYREEYRRQGTVAGYRH